ncbi:hypothetical protein F511_29125 [Dorcoceras hygrometricum]|uniref:Uncharacterized protein n=1 Tax=Dorcoceras hygrometricum TaxID=472368 RepID=A0A2Z7DE22_9LAMI|nr:hypothetical protein F511_29125 [Dorcoceras hygrometricum]
MSASGESSTTMHRGLTQSRRFMTPNCVRYRQSGPRPDTRLLRHPALEGVTRSARTDYPRRIGRNKFPAKRAAAAAHTTAAATA